VDNFEENSAGAGPAMPEVVDKRRFQSFFMRRNFVIQLKMKMVMKNETSLRKQEIRRQTAERLRALDAHERAERSGLLAGHLLAALAGMWPEPAGRCLMAFAPVRAEPDIRPVLDWAWASGVTVLLPRIDPAADRIVPCAVDGWASLLPGAFGILEPGPSAPPWPRWEAIDLVLVPGLAFDREGYRIGSGRGYYDRFFAELAARRGALGVQPALPERWAAAFSVCVVDAVPREPHDVPVDRVFTERGAEVGLKPGKE